MRSIPFMFALSLCLVTAAARAEHGPPSVLVDAKALPACFAVAPTYLLAPQQGRYQPAKGPAVALANHCKDTITITGVTADKKALASSAMRLTSMVEGYAKYSEFIFTAEGKDCSYPLPKPNPRKARCKNLVIGAGDTLTVPIPWGSAFEISGAMDGDAVTATGTILNPRDPAQAIPLSLPAAQGGDADAQYQLAVLYGREGPKRNPAEALRWLKAAANAGNVKAQIDLAMRYEMGDGVLVDPVEACFWWELVGKNPWDPFHPSKEQAERRLTDAQLDSVKKRVQDWKPVTYTEQK